MRKQAGWRIEIWIIDKVNEIAKLRDDPPRKIVETALKEYFEKNNQLSDHNKVVTSNKVVTKKDNQNPILNKINQLKGE